MVGGVPALQRGKKNFLNLNIDLNRVMALWTIPFSHCCFWGRKLDVLGGCKGERTWLPGVCFRGGVDHRLFRVRSGGNLNLSFSLYWFCDLGQANSPSESQFPICKTRTLTHFAQCWEFQSQTGKPSAPSKYFVNTCSLHRCQVSCCQGWRGEGKYENI